MFKLVLEKSEEPAIKLPTPIGSSNKQEFQKKIYFCFIDYAKAFDCVDHNFDCGKFWKRWNIRLPGLPPEKSMQVKKHQLKLDMEQQTVSKLGKEYVKAEYCHPAYLTYMQSTSWKTLGWMKHSWNQDCQEKYQ